MNKLIIILAALSLQACAVIDGKGMAIQTHLCEQGDLGHCQRLAMGQINTKTRSVQEAADEFTIRCTATVRRHNLVDTCAELKVAIIAR